MTKTPASSNTIRGSIMSFVALYPLCRGLFIAASSADAHNAAMSPWSESPSGLSRAPTLFPCPIGIQTDWSSLSDLTPDK